MVARAYSAALLPGGGGGGVSEGRVKISVSSSEALFDARGACDVDRVTRCAGFSSGGGTGVIAVAGVTRETAKRRRGRRSHHGGRRKRAVACTGSAGRSSRPVCAARSGIEAASSDGAASEFTFRRSTAPAEIVAPATTTAAAPSRQFRVGASIAGLEVTGIGTVPPFPPSCNSVRS